MLKFLFGWFRSKPIIIEPTLDQALTDIQKLKSTLDDIYWYITENHNQILPEQTKLFMNNSEFALTSLISCLATAKDNERNQKLQERVKEIVDGKI